VRFRTSVDIPSAAPLNPVATLTRSLAGIYRFSSCQGGKPSRIVLFEITATELFVLPMRALLARSIETYSTG
jgi:hypothetical protein